MGYNWQNFYENIFYRLIEHRVISSASIFSPEIKYLCDYRLAYFFGNEVDFKRVTNVMNDIAGMERNRKRGTH